MKLKILEFTNLFPFRVKKEPFRRAVKPLRFIGSKNQFGSIAASVACMMALNG